MDKIISVLDLGTTKIVCLAGKKTTSGYQVIAACEAPSEGILRGEVINNKNVLSTIIPLIQEVEQHIGQPISEVVVGIAGQHIRSQAVSTTLNRSNKEEEISQEEVDTLCKSMYSSRVQAGEEVLHVIPQSYHVDDYQNIETPVGVFGSCVEANYRLFIGNTASAQHTRRCIESANLKLNRLILEPLASAEAVLCDDEKEMGVAMIDIGGGTTDLLIYQDNIIRHSAVIPFGGNVITEDIRQGCQVTKRRAEQIKIQHGICYSDLAPENKAIVISGIGGREEREISFKFLASIIEARMEEILEAVLYEIQQSGYAGNLPAGIVVTGGGALLTGLCEFIKYKTGYDARVALPNQVDTELCPDVNRVTYSCAVGLMMKGFDREENQNEEAEKDLSSIFAVPLANNAQAQTTKEKTKKVKVPKEKSAKGENFISSLFNNFFTEGDNEA